MADRNQLGTCGSLTCLGRKAVYQLGRGKKRMNNLLRPLAQTARAFWVQIWAYEVGERLLAIQS